MLKLLSGLFGIISGFFTLFNEKKIGDAAVSKVELSAAEREIKEMDNDKDFADSIRNDPAALERVRLSTNQTDSKK